MTDSVNKYLLFIDCNGVDGAGLGQYFAELRLTCSIPDAMLVFGANDAPATVYEGPVEILAQHRPSEALTYAFRRATLQKAHFVYLRAPLTLSDAAIRSMQHLLDEDPLFGAVIPRFSDEATDLVWSVPWRDESSRPLLTRRALAALPRRWVISEIGSACCLIRSSQVANPPFLPGYETLQGSVLHFLCSIRRRTFRPVIDNRTILPAQVSGGELYPALPETDRETFRNTVFTRFTFPQAGTQDNDYFTKTFPAEDKVNDWFDIHPCHRLERLCAAAYPAAGLRRSILVDCRGMLAHYCGTTVSQLGFLKGFEELTERWDICVLAQGFAIAAHDLPARFPKLRFSEQPHGNHAAMIHMNQLCFSGILCDLHRHGFATACNMLDTIMWDMILGAPEHVGRIWDLDATYLDCIFYISEFSRGQFNRRFPVNSGIAEVITYLSLSHEENTVDEFRDAPVGDYVLIFGNAYDHKDVFPTVQRLHRNFPLQPIIALGPECASVDNVTFLQSGTLPDGKIEGLVASAKVVVFPSWNEGFGLPVVKALAYGRPVVVRELPLWDEIAGQCRLPGMLMSFCDEETLCSVVRAALSGHSERVIEQGGTFIGKPLDWTACAERILNGFELYLEGADSTAWLQREKVVRMLDR